MKDNLPRDVDDIRRKWVPDSRLGVFDVAVSAEGVRGRTSSREAQDALRKLARDAALPIDVRLLPDPAVRADPAAIVTAAVAPLLAEPRIVATRVSEALHGECLDVLERQDQWLRVRARDGYVAWLHGGYAATGPEQWAADWDERAAARSLARVARRRAGSVELAEGQLAAISSGSVRLDGELRVEARHLALPELARKWYGGAPYLWGGRTEWGIDCSGLVQAVYGARGIRLPRDSDQQYVQGREVAESAEGEGYEAGDLLFFAEQGRVSHVALWAGAGRIVHSAVSRGGVGGDHLFGEEPRMKRLRENLVGVRRM
jgi:cell wall-associated NlpC family hydrolase